MGAEENGQVHLTEHRSRMKCWTWRHWVLCTVISTIQAAPGFSIMLDETTNTASKEQLGLCLRWVDDSLESHEDFIGLREIESTSSANIVHTIWHTMIRLNLSSKKVRGQCYDGAACMSGKREEVATQICKEQRAVYTHCYGHTLNLAVQIQWRIEDAFALFGSTTTRKTKV